MLSWFENEAGGNTPKYGDNVKGVNIQHEIKSFSFKLFIKKE